MANNKRRTELLPADALNGKRLGLSVSDSPDLERLGLLDAHFRMTLGELARTAIIPGGFLYYGGHLQSDGITCFLVDELHRYGRRDRPFKVCLAWTVHRAMTSVQLAEQKDLLGLFGEIYFLSREDGQLVEPSDAEPRKAFTPDEHAQSLSSLRAYLTVNTDARIVVGGKRSGFQGAMPGIVEEVLIALNHRQPIYLAGGFGGATLDIIRTLRPKHAEWFPVFQDSSKTDLHMENGLVRIAETVRKGGWDGYDNGLTEEENLLLAASYRPSEIAALVGRGLGRLLSS